MSTLPRHGDLVLRPLVDGDLPTLFQQQLDPEANWLAAFTAKDPTDRNAFDAHWAKVRADASIPIRTILHRGLIAGYILSHGWFGEPEVTYWLGRQFWGQGIATRALSAFLVELKTRPLYARAAKDNLASIRVLKKCGFRVTREDRGFANARDEEIEEVVLALDPTKLAT